MSSSTTDQHDHGQINISESKTVTTIHRIYREDNEDLVLRDPNKRRSFINRSAYAKLHRSYSSGSNRHSVGNLKDRFENLTRQDSKEQSQNEDPKKPTEREVVASDEVKLEPPESPTEEFTPASFGYPKTAKLVPPLIKPKPQVRRKLPKDVNSNLINRKSESSDAEEERDVIQQSASEESVYKIAKELNNFTMDGKSKKRVGSFRKLFLGGLFGKDKKKKEEERSKQKYGDNTVQNDNLKNESNFSRQSPQRQSVTNSYNQQRNQELHEEKVKELEQKYAEMHVNRFNKIRQTFSEEKNTQDYVPMNNTKKKPTISDYISNNTTLVKYIDTSSSGSTESEKQNGVIARDTPPRAQETYQNIRVVKPKSIGVERPETTSPRTIERNLNRSNSKDYPDKANVTLEDTYGTVFDSTNVKHVNTTPVKSPLSLETTKLKLPPNREIYEPLPRVKSPIPINRVSTEKIIATELLKNTTRSPTPPKRSEVVTNKPPMSPKSSRTVERQCDKIVTNAMVHAPRRAATPTNFRVSTPIDLRMSVSMKMSPQKKDIRKSVEEYYWKELKKLKEEEDSKLYALQVSGYLDEQAKLRRSRSLSPSSQRIGRRSLSLPRDNRGVYDSVGRIQPQQSIPENQALMTDGRTSSRFVYDQSFVRNNPERRSVDSLQRPIFRRGSLTKQEIYETQPYNKRVSFSNNQQIWPTRNGYTQSPPQRRLDSELLDDDVFVQSPKEPIYGSRYYVQNEPLYSNRISEQLRAQQQQYDSIRRPIYGPVNPQMGLGKSSMDSLQRQEVYISRNQLMRRPVSNVPEEYGQINFQRYPSNSQLQRNSVYSSRQSMAEPIYGQKQVTLRNKYCDIYGQIHDAPQTGVVMGQLQNGPAVPPHQPGFVRGSRLTSSANDIGRRYYEPTYIQKYSTNYDNRPLPPPPKPNRHMQISDTESGSDASEIQRIMQTKTKSKKRGLFGK